MTVYRCKMCLVRLDERDQRVYCDMVLLEHPALNTLELFHDCYNSGRSFLTPINAAQNTLYYRANK